MIKQFIVVWTKTGKNNYKMNIIIIEFFVYLNQTFQDLILTKNGNID
jgi:hypothetical protein